VFGLNYRRRFVLGIARGQSSSMARMAQSRNLKGFGWLTKKQVTYRRHVGKERQELKRQAFEERKERIALKELEAKERAADARIAAAQRKIETAAKKTDSGGMSEAKFDAMKARMEKEIEKQEEFKAAALAKVNPSWGYGIYTGTGFTTDQVAHFKSKAAAETYARSQGLTGYRIRRSFAKDRNPCASTRKADVTDRAKRYRANQLGCKPAGAKKCKLCGSKSDVMVDHVDGNESNGRKSNLRWLCRSCNTVLGAEMARTGQGRRTVQYNPAHKGAQTLGEYMQAVLQHTRGAHDDGGRIIHDTPKRKREEFASEIWAARKARGNPTSTGGTSKGNSCGQHDRGLSRNPALEFSTEYHLGYNLGQADRQSARLRKTLDELHATFNANFAPGAMASWESFEQAYQAGYGGQMGAAAPNPYPSGDAWSTVYKTRAAAQSAWYDSAPGRNDHATFKKVRGGWVIKPDTRWNPTRTNPESEGDGSEEYQQAKRIAELFHGRPVKEEVTITDQVDTPDWYAEIGPLVELRIKGFRGYPFRTAKFRFGLDEKRLIHLLTSPDGRQMYLRGGDQEIDLEALDMGPDSEWFRDMMSIGEVTYFAYRDGKRFHGFKMTEYTHKVGSALDSSGTRHIQKTNSKPVMIYDTRSKLLSFAGGQGKVETDDLVEGMSPGIVA
jgi:Arc/MetJ-type ribon-helix-helix transcriptional regulator